MDWLNYHHLRYFWVVAKEGSLARAAERLGVSQPSISTQVRELESALGERLFLRDGRKNRLTDTGQLVFGFAEEIFALGGELLSAVKQQPGAKVLRLTVGIVDTVPKLVSHEILKPVFALSKNVHLVCREGKMEDLLVQLAAHRLDIILTDEPASSSVKFNAYSHSLGETGTVFCAEPQLARKLKRGFPKSLHRAPAMLPAGNSTFRRALEAWFRSQHLQPHVVAEFDDLALMKVMAAEGRGFVAIPAVAMREAVERYDFKVIGQTKQCRSRFYAVTAERRVLHPAVSLLTAKARDDLFR